MDRPVLKVVLLESEEKRQKHAWISGNGAVN